MVDRIFGQMSDLKVGKYVVADNHPCRVVSVDKSKPGKHGAAKMSVVCISIFDGSKHSIMKPSDADVEIPIVERKRAQVVSVSASGDAAQLMDLSSYETFDVSVPDEMRAEMEVGKEIEYIEVMGRRLLTRVYEGE
ncbi:MAG: translation initiation factor IF-5A [Candidatus Norongarragalinales archaeon]